MAFKVNLHLTTHLAHEVLVVMDGIHLIICLCLAVRVWMLVGNISNSMTSGNIHQL